MRGSFIILALVFITAEVWAQDGLLVKWESRTLLFNIKQDIQIRKIPPDLPKIHCLFENKRTNCYSTALDNKHTETDLKYTRPIAHFPQLSSVAGAKYVSPPPEKRLDSTFLRRLPELQLRRPPAKKIATFPNTITTVEPSITHATVYASVTEAVEGQFALDSWRGLVGKLPTRQCTPANYCTIVLEGRYLGDDVLAHCAILNSKLGLGLPYICEIVAINKHSEWLILSYDGPGFCDGCGTGVGAGCTVPGKEPDEVARALILAFKQGITNLSLEITSKSENAIVLFGKNVAVQSKFVDGYYDKSVGMYTI